jgi:hypothetical protein
MNLGSWIMKVVQRMNLEEVAQWVKFGKVEPWMYSVKKH